MADKDQNPEELKQRLWKEIEQARIVMLGLVGGQPHHMQPMAAFADAETNAIWFYTKRQTDLVRDAGQSHDAMVCVMAKDMEFQACVEGALQPSHDQSKIDQYWSPFVAAWYPEGKDDTDLTLMRLDCADARIWASNRGPVSYSFQIAKANATHQLPDVGGVADVTF